MGADTSGAQGISAISDAAPRSPPSLPPSISRTPDASSHPILVQSEAEQENPRSVVRGAVPWMLSLVVHQAIIIALALWVVSGIAGGDGDVASLFASYAAEDDDLVDDSILVSEPLMASDVPDASEFELAEFAEPSEALASNVIIEPGMPMPDSDLSGLAFEPRDAMSDIPARVVRSTIDTGGLREATSVEGATGGVVGDILGELAEGDLLVVWLFDQSISLVDDRQRVAAKLKELFEQTRARAAESGHVLKNAAVAFGKQVRQMVPPTESTERIVKAVSQVPTDESGLERVFGAIGWSAEKYGKRSDARVLIVVWTDESGDDIDQLERTIALCQKRNVSVSAVGPSAILGRRDGIHSWLHQPSGKVFQLSVMRGPDSALPERLLLPYWWPTRGPEASGLSFGWRRGRGRTLPPWYGGEQLEGMASGMGPYGLTRLALETGGTYTIFDRPLDRGPFRLERMRPYAPDYRAPLVVAQDLKYRPLPRAVLQAVDLLARHSPATQPANDYFGRRYQAPLQFRGQLKNALKVEATQATRHLRTVEAALSAFGDGGMEEHYGTEPSPRFQAWYDLTRGRLLAAGVRYMEFLYSCDLTVRSLDGATNRVVFIPSSELRCPSTTRYWAEEAERLLRRCVDDHADTPWAHLAQRELAYPLGVSLQQAVIPKPPPRPLTPVRPRGGGPPSGGGGAVVLPKL